MWKNIEGTCENILDMNWMKEVLFLFSVLAPQVTPKTAEGTFRALSFAMLWTIFLSSQAYLQKLFFSPLQIYYHLSQLYYKLQPSLAVLLLFLAKKTYWNLTWHIWLHCSILWSELMERRREKRASETCWFQLKTRSLHCRQDVMTKTWAHTWVIIIIARPLLILKITRMLRRSEFRMNCCSIGRAGIRFCWGRMESSQECTMYW